MCQCMEKHHGMHHGHGRNSECTCSVLLPVTEEIKQLEDHKQRLKEKLSGIDKKLEQLKSIDQK